MDKQAFLNRFLLHNQPVSADLRTAEKSLFVNNKSLKKAAVLIPLVKRENGLNIILTERALHLRHHPGQVSFISILHYPLSIIHSPFSILHSPLSIVNYQLL